MATLRRKKAEPFSVFQRDPGPWPPILLNWMATLAIIMVFGLVMLFSASYTTGYLRFGDSFHYIKSQLLCTVLGLGMMFLFSYFDHRFLRRMVKLGYVVCLILLVLVLFSSPINGCRRWISFGGLTLQASEVAKFEMILLTADIAARTPQVRFGEVPLRKWVHHSIVVELIRPILWLVPVLILLVLEPHMSGIPDHGHRGHHPAAGRQRRHHYLGLCRCRAVPAGDFAEARGLHRLPAEPSGRLDAGS